jgi:predicted metal-dependent hydrolase
MTETLIVAGLTFQVVRRSRRRTVGLTIDQDALRVSAPVECSRDRLEQCIRERLDWVYRHLPATPSRPSQPPPVRQFISGEGFYYLGRSYRLWLVDKSGEREEPPLRLAAGRFLLDRAEQGNAREHFIHWYSEHAHPWLTRQVLRLGERMGLACSRVEVKDLGVQWTHPRGSNLLVHWRTICLPPSRIEYVVAYGLAQMVEKSRKSTSLWSRIERVLPDYQERKRWLEREGARFGM